LDLLSGELMKRFFTIFALLLAIALPAAAQWQQRRLSGDDQRRFDSYYSRWQDYRRTNNRDQISSMENRMQDIYRHYGIPADTPYGRIASNGGDRGWGRDRDWDRDRDRDRDWDRDRDRNRDWDRDRDRGSDRGRFRGRLNSQDQARFDSYYSRWLQYRQTNNRSEMASMEARMRGIMNSNQIPLETPFGEIASRR
jgi:hypothetical protein